MATTVVNPAPNGGSGNGMGFLVGIIVLIVFAVIFFVYGIPYIQQGFGGTQVNVPDTIEVNVNQPK